MKPNDQTTDPEQQSLVPELSRRGFLHGMGGAGVFLGMGGFAASGAEAPTDADGNVIPGFEKGQDDPNAAKGWEPVSERKIKVGIAGYGLCKFGAAFFYQNHPNVEVVAATDLDPVRCTALAKAVGAKKTYPSCEEMIKDKEIEAVYIATDAPSHGRLSIMALEHGKHVCSAVPAVFGLESLEEADALLEAVRKSGMKYQMNETSYYHADLYAWRQRYKADAFGKIIYSEGEYFHYFGKPIGGYNPKTGKVDVNGWRKGLPPQWYPTHSNAYHIGITGGSFTEVSCMGMPSSVTCSLRTTTTRTPSAPRSPCSGPTMAACRAWPSPGTSRPTAESGDESMARKPPTRK
ncbi:MAG: Gfo/Idh/MocA family protein [Haloferula sp.]